MSEGTVFDYYYGAESEQFSFIRIPKLLLFDPKFADLTIGSIMLYGVLLDRMNLSREHRWIDEDHRVYIRFKIQEIQDTLNISEKTATTYLSGLEKIGLVEKVKVGLGQGNILYVKNFITSDLKKKAFITGKNYCREDDEKLSKIKNKEANPCKEPEKDAGKPSKNHIPVESAGNEAVKIGGNEAVKISGNGAVDFDGQNNTEINNNKYNNNPIPSHHNKYYEIYLSRLKKEFPEDGIGWIDESNRARVFREGVRMQIQYDYLEECEEVEIDKVDEIVEQMVEVMMDDSPKIRIASKLLDADYVKSRLFLIRRAHINYILYSMKNLKNKVGNIKSYLQATIFNSLTTIGNYYSAEARYAIYGMASE